MPAKKFKTMTRQDTEHILLHELAHIKRGDLLVHAVYMIVQIAYWFNPLLWIIRRTLQNLRELCCDATVAKLLREDTVHYRQTLLETARQLLAEPVDPGLGLLGLFENNNWLVTRLRWLEKNTWKNRPLRIATIILLVAVMTACVLPMAQAKSGGKTIITKEYRLMRHIKSGEQTMMRTVNNALDRPFVDLAKELTGQNRSRNYDMMEYDNFGLLVLTATVNQHSKAEKALQREYGPALRPEKLYLQNHVQTIDTFAENCKKIVKNTFIQLNLMFLTTEDIDYIANDLRDFVKQYTRNDLSKAMQLQILEELDRYIFMNFSSRTLSNQESIYLRFDDRYKSLKFKLWQVIATEPLTEEQRTKLAEQKEWIYDYVSKNYPITKELEKVRRMYRVDRVFQDVLNGFSQQPMSDGTFKKLQEEIRNEDNVGGIASKASCWSTYIAGYEYGLNRNNVGEWKLPFATVTSYGGGSDDVHFSFKSDKPYLYDNFRLYYYDGVSAKKFENHTYNIASMRALRAPDDCKTTEQLLAWIDKQNQGDIYYDKKSESIVCCRDAKMAVLDVNNWIESDRISTEDLRNQIRNNSITSFCIANYWTLSDVDFGLRDPKPVVPIIAVETKEGAVALLRPKDLKHRSPDSTYLEVRFRPENWRQQWFSTFITGDTNETIGQRHISSTTQNLVQPVLRSFNEGGSEAEGSELKANNYTATLPNGVTVEQHMGFTMPVYDRNAESFGQYIGGNLTQFDTDYVKLERFGFQLGVSPEDVFNKQGQCAFYMKEGHIFVPVRGTIIAPVTINNPRPKNKPTWIDCIQSMTQQKILQQMKEASSIAFSGGAVRLIEKVEFRTVTPDGRAVVTQLGSDIQLAEGEVYGIITPDHRLVIMRVDGFGAYDSGAEATELTFADTGSIDPQLLKNVSLRPGGEREVQQQP